MTLEIHVNEELLTSFIIREPDLLGWDNCEARIRVRDYYLKQFFVGQTATFKKPE